MVDKLLEPSGGLYKDCFTYALWCCSTKSEYILENSYVLCFLFQAGILVATLIIISRNYDGFYHRRLPLLPTGLKVRPQLYYDQLYA